MAEEKVPGTGPDVKDILRSGRFKKAGSISHHGSCSLAAHSLKTARFGRRICLWLRRHHINVNEEDVVRACLLHDIGMTDDVISDSLSARKAYTHPNRGAEIAREEFRANKVQCDAIRRHMWPICVIPPRSLEGWVVVAADKTCSLWELLHRKSR